MRWLVAPTPEQAGNGSLDFCWANPGEILIPSGMKCTSGYPTDRCGCCRAISGLVTRKASTIGVVKEVHLAQEKMARQDVLRFWNDTLPAATVELFTDGVLEHLRAVSQDLWRFAPGDRVCFKFTRAEEDGVYLGHELEILPAGGVTVNDGFGV